MKRIALQKREMQKVLAKANSNGILLAEVNAQDVKLQRKVSNYGR